MIHRNGEPCTLEADDSVGEVSQRVADRLIPDNVSEALVDYNFFQRVCHEEVQERADDVRLNNSEPLIDMGISSPKPESDPVPLANPSPAAAQHQPIRSTVINSDTLSSHLQKPCVRPYPGRSSVGGLASSPQTGSGATKFSLQQYRQMVGVRVKGLDAKEKIGIKVIAWKIV